MTPNRKVSTGFHPLPGRAAKRLSLEPSASVLRNVTIAGFRITERFFSAGATIRISSGDARIVCVAEGRCSEIYQDGNSIGGGAGTLWYVPAGLARSSSYQPGSRCLIVEIEPEMLARVAPHTEALARPGKIQSAGATWLAQRLHRELEQDGAASRVSLHGILLELLAEAARFAGAGPVRVIPEWLRNAREYLESNCLRPVSLAEVARVAHVNRVHLARQFRACYSTSVGEFLRRKRVEHACGLMKSTRESLAEVAIDCGFSDQSHFSSIFRRQMGITPARYRELAHSPAQN